VALRLNLAARGRLTPPSRSELEWIVRVTGASVAGLLLLTGCATSPAPRPHVAGRERPPEVAERTPPAAMPDPEEAVPSPAGGSPAAETLERAAARGWHLPVINVGPEAVISRFGDPRDGGRRMHEGIDIAAVRGTPVVAPVGGRIVVSGARSLGGNVVVLIDASDGYEFVFSHLHTRAVDRGQIVGAGELLGTVGTTGNAAGGPPHLHFEVRLASAPVDPYPLFAVAARSGGQ